VPAVSELRLHCPAQSQYVALVRHALAAFLEALEFERQSLDDVTTAAGEALANIVEHAYVKGARHVDCYFDLCAKVSRKGMLFLDVSDGGLFVERAPLPGRGFGLRIIRAIAADLTIDKSAGTHLRMTFECKR
jgi:serine/threonine-protein kinase RsbW